MTTSLIHQPICSSFFSIIFNFSPHFICIALYFFYIAYKELRIVIYVSLLSSPFHKFVKKFFVDLDGFKRFMTFVTPANSFKIIYVFVCRNIINFPRRFPRWKETNTVEFHYSLSTIVLLVNCSCLYLHLPILNVQVVQPSPGLTPPQLFQNNLCALTRVALSNLPHTALAPNSLFSSSESAKLHCN